MKRSSLIIAVVFFSALSAFAKDWRGIVPLHATRADVEHLLGPPEIDRGDMIFYTVDFTKVSFHFPQSPCGGPGAVWNVARDTVTDIWVMQKSPHELRFSELKLGSGFRTEKHLELGHILFYINDNEGIAYEVDTSAGIVTLTMYSAAASDNRLRCPTEPRPAPNKSLDARLDSVFLNWLC